MAVFLKHLLKKSCAIRNLNPLNPIRSIMQSSVRTEKAIEVLKCNPFYEKYAKKIASLQQTSPEEFLSRIEATVKQKQKPKFGDPKERQFSSLLQPKDQTIPAYAKNKQLSDIMKVELIQDKSSDEIKQIWEQYHITKDVIAATIPGDIYDLLLTKSKKYPTFLFPLPRTEGYEFILCQFSQNTVHFTPLICYQVHKENAPECLTITHYTELKDDKNLVLMRGEFDKNVIDAMEAQCLANQLQLYYASNDEMKDNLLELFTSKPDDFKHMELIGLLAKVSLNQ